MLAAGTARQRCVRRRLSALVFALACAFGGNLPMTMQQQCEAGHNRRTMTLAGAFPVMGNGAARGLRDGNRALFSQPSGVSFSSEGTHVAVSDANNSALRLVTVETGNCTTIAGLGVTGQVRHGFADGPGARFNYPLGVTFSKSGQLLAVADQRNGLVRLLSRPLDSPPRAAYTLGAGVGTNFSDPADVSFAPSEQTVAVAERGAHRVRVVNVSSGKTTMLAGISSSSGLVDGLAAQARFNRPSGVAFSPDGNSIAVADSGNNVVRLIGLANITVKTVAGMAAPGFNDGLEASFSDPRGVSFSPDGTALAVADCGNNAIRMINLSSGVTTTVAGRAPFSMQPIEQTLVDGVAPAFDRPTAVAFSPDGVRLAVADSGNHAIRMISLRCAACEPDTYKTTVGQADCSSCLSNMTSPEGSTSISDCKCRPGFVLKDGVCAACTPGKYNAERGALECLDCPDDTFSGAIAATSRSACSPCPQWTLSGAGADSEVDCLCMAGFTGSNGNCSACPKGTYKEANGSALCTMCKTGTFSHMARMPRCGLCRAGTFSPPGASSCSLCGAGKYSEVEGSPNCTSCEVGKFSNDTGSTACTKCAAGFFSNTSNADTCQSCGAGKYSSVNGSSFCTGCEKGKASSILSATFCKRCVAGKYAGILNATSCLVCSAGKYSVASESNCSNCPANTFSGEGSSNCTCNAGYAGADMGPCIACGPGKYTWSNGSRVCLLCAEGKFEGGNASSSCSSCPSSATSPVGSLQIADCECEAGYTDANRVQAFNVSRSAGSNSTNSIGEVDQNRTENANRSSSMRINSNQTRARSTPLQCRACPPGTFKSAVGSGTCSNCSENTFATIASQACTACPAFSSAPSSSGQISDCRCNLGYQLLGGVCSLPNCASGEYNPDSARSDAYVLQCQPCPRNSWSESGRVGLRACACNAGYSGSNGGPCKACQIGDYKSTIGSTPCDLCPQNSFTEREFAAEKCMRCPNNSYSFEGSSGEMSCSCNRGFTGPRCVVVSPLAEVDTSSCSMSSSRKFEVDLSMSVTADSESESERIRTKIAKETANYFGLNATLSEYVSGSALSGSRRAVYDIVLKQQLEGNQQQFSEGAEQQASALTSFLQIRGLRSVKVQGIHVSCGAGFTKNGTTGIDTGCLPCAVGKYKERLDNSDCLDCPESRTTTGTGATELSLCSSWAGQRLSDQTATELGHLLSVVVGSVVGVNTLGAAISVLSSASGASLLGPGASSLYASGGTSTSSTVQGFTSPGGLRSGWGGGGPTMALLAQVQSLQIMLRIGGSKDRMGLFRFADSIGWFNFEFGVSFFGLSSTSQSLMVTSPPSDVCGFETLAPTLDKLLWCAIILAAVAVVRLCLALFVWVVWKEVPRAMHFPLWEGPVFLVEFIAVCVSTFSAIATSCGEWMVIGYLVLSMVPVAFVCLSAIVLGRHLQREHMVYEPYDAKADPPRVPPSFAEMKKYLQGSTGIVPKAMHLREWYLAVEARGWWKDGSENAWGLQFLVRDYVGSAWFFGIWVLVKKVLISAATTVVGGHGSAIMCIIVQTFDTLLILGLRPYVSKITCLSECLASLTNWFAYLFLGLLAWPGSTPLQLGEMTGCVLALTGTGFAIIAASVEALMAALTIMYHIFAGLGECIGMSGPYIQKCCFGTPAARTIEGDDGPIFLTSVASDWIEPEQQTTDVSLSMGYPFYVPGNPGLSYPQDPAVLAAYYRQLADYHQMMSYSMKASTGSADPGSSVVSPVSMSTAPTTFYNAGAVQTQNRSLSFGGNDAGGTQNSQGAVAPRSDPRESRPAVATASLFRPATDSPIMFSRRSASNGRQENSRGASLSTASPFLGRDLTTNGGNGYEKSSLPLARMPHQLYPFSSERLSSSPPPASSRDGRPFDDALYPKSSPLSDMRWRASPPPQSARGAGHRDYENGYTSSSPASARTIHRAHSPRVLPDRDSPWSVQSTNSSHSEGPRNGIVRSAEAQRQKLLRSETPRSVYDASSALPVHAHGSAGSRVRRDANNSSGRLSASPSAPMVLSEPRQNSPHIVISPTGAGRSMGDEDGAHLLTPRKGAGSTSDKQPRMPGLSPLNLPPAPDYPAPPPPATASPRAAIVEAPSASGDSEWETGFG